MSNTSVMIVEDNVDLARAMAALLKRAGFSPVTTGNGDRALRLMRDKAPTLVLLDINLPIRNGLQVLEQMRRDPQLEEIRVVVYTAIDEHETRDQALSMGALAYVVKGSLDGASLAQLVRQHTDVSLA